MSTRQERVLVCEDEAIIRVWLRRELTAQGFEVVGEANDGDSAVELAEQLNPELIIMDIKMPRRDGLSASIEILLRKPVPIIILTAYGEAELVARALDAGVSGYLVKPIEGKQLGPAISMARARFSELLALKGQVTSLEEALEQRKLLDRAKGLLMRRYGIDEPGAHQLIQRISSQQRVSVKETLSKIISEETNRENTPKS